MDIRKLQRAIVDGLEDVKAQDIVVFNTEHLSPLFERVIIASGTSNRQTKALASSVRDAVRSQGLPVLGMEGGDNGEWIIVDCGAAVAHIMQPAIRDYYRLEEIWGGKSVKMKIGSDAPRRLVKAENEDDEDEDDVPSLPVKKPVAKTVAARSGPGKSASAPRSALAKKVAPAKKAVAGRAAPAGRAPAAKKAAPGAKPAARKAAVKTIVTPRKAPAAKKAAPAKSAARKTSPRR